jgi:hypothetical protein
MAPVKAMERASRENVHRSGDRRRVAAARECRPCWAGFPGFKFNIVAPIAALTGMHNRRCT